MIHDTDITFFPGVLSCEIAAIEEDVDLIRCNESICRSSGDGFVPFILDIQWSKEQSFVPKLLYRRFAVVLDVGLDIISDDVRLQFNVLNVIQLG